MMKKRSLEDLIIIDTTTDVATNILTQMRY